MLSGNKLCGLQSQNFSVMSREYLNSNMFSDDCQLLMTIKEAFSLNPKLKNTFASEMLTALRNYVPIPDEKYSDMYSWLAIQGVLSHSLVFAYDTEESSADKKFRLYTASVGVLKDLAKKGILHGKKDAIEIELQKIVETLTSDKKWKNLCKTYDKFLCVRLDYELYEGNKVIFKPTIPKSALTSDRFIFVHYDTVNSTTLALRDMLYNSVLEFTMGDKVRSCTLNSQLLEMIYGNKAYTDKLLDGNKDIRTNSFYLPSLGASIYSAGITNIRLTEVDKVRQINSIAELDLSEIHMNFDLVKPFFYRTIGKFTKSNWQVVLDHFCPDGVSEDKHPADIIFDVTRSTGGHEIWKFMKKHPDLFDLEACKNQPNPYGDEYVPLTIPTSVKDLQDLMNAGTFKIVIQNKSGSYSTIIGSNSHAELKRVLGDDYLQLESEGVRLRALASKIRKYTSSKVSASKLKSMCESLLLESLYFDIMVRFQYEFETTKSVDKDEIANWIEIYLHEVELRTTVVKQPHLVTIRNFNYTKTQDGKVLDYYKNLDIRRVKEIVLLHRLNSN